MIIVNQPCRMLLALFRSLRWDIVWIERPAFCIVFRLVCPLKLRRNESNKKRDDLHTSSRFFTICVCSSLDLREVS